MMEERQRLLEYLARGFLDNPKQLPTEYYYASLPLCVVDAVFSIGIHYDQTMRVVQNVGRNLGTAVFREYGSSAPRGEHPTISEFLDRIGGDAESATEAVFQDRHRTSAKSGILKTEAVIQFCGALAGSGIQQFADVTDSARVERARDLVLKIKGQGKGVSWSYFLMLAGDDRGVKPDRMVIRFVEEALGRKGVTLDEAEKLVISAADEIARHGTPITPRQLDYIIWDFERGRPRGNKFGGRMLPADQMTKLSQLVKNGTIPISNAPGKKN